MTVTPETPEAQELGGGVGDDAASHGSRWRRLALSHSFEWLSAAGLAVALVVLMVVISTQTPFFFTQGNFINVGRAAAETGIVAAAMTLVLVCAELDLSVGAVIARGGIAAAKVLNAGYPGELAIATGLAVGVCAGAVNAGLIVGLGVNALICTIGTQFAFRGLAYIWTNGNSLNAYGYSGFAYLGQGKIGSIYFSTILTLLVFLVLGLVLAKTRYGSHIYAIGGDRLASKRVGIRPGRVRASVYVLSGAAAALGGLVVTSANGSASPQAGLGDELLIISAVIIGGTALVGGRGNLIGTFLGVAFLAVLQNGMDLVGLQAYWQIFIEGVVLIIAVTIDEYFRRRRQREE